MTEEEHIARAMLMGMRYHHGNGEPFYYKMHPDGAAIGQGMLDANTLEPVEDVFIRVNRIYKLRTSTWAENVNSPSSK